MARPKRIVGTGTMSSQKQNEEQKWQQEFEKGAAKLKNSMNSISGTNKNTKNRNYLKK